MIDIPTTLVTLKAIAGVAKDSGRIDLYQDVITLQQTLLEALGENTTKVAENSRLTMEAVSLRERVATLERQLAAREEMIFERNVYWRRQDGAEKEGPFCPKCLDGEHRVSRMVDRSDDHWWRCTVCERTIEKPGPHPQPHPYSSDIDYDPFRA